MTRKHATYRASFEWLQQHFGLEEEVFNITVDNDRNIINLHVTAPHLMETPEGGATPCAPLRKHEGKHPYSEDIE